MDISKRQKQALEMLLRGDGEMTLAQIAAQLSVSTRTIHRELSTVAPILRQSYRLELASRSGHGLRIVGDPEHIQTCLAELENTSSDELVPEERRRLLAAMLLDAPDVIKLFALTADLATTTPIVRADLDLLHPWFTLHGLNLVLKRGLGVLLEGTEASRRQALSALIMEQFGEAGLLRLIRGELPTPNGQSQTVAYMLRIVTLTQFLNAESALGGLPRGCLPQLAPRDYLGLAVHMAVAASRAQSQRQLAPVDTENSGNEAPAAAAVALGRALSTHNPEIHIFAEIHALDSYLRGAKPARSGGDLLDATSIASLAEIQELISACSRTSGLEFGDDRILRDGLAAHWGPALYRLHNNLPIRNPLLDQIKSGYAELFSATAQAVALVFPDLSVPEDEIGYLVLHFGSSLGRRGQARERFRALVVCSAGIGSAHMLASRIRSELPEIDIVANLSWFDVKDIAQDSWDILVSTIPLPLDPADYIMVNPLLDAVGIQAIRDGLDRRRQEIHHRAVPTDKPHEESTLFGLKQMSRHLSAVIGILEQLQVFQQASIGTGSDPWMAFLQATIERCVQSKLVRNAQAALADLGERSNDRGIMLPNSRILFLHCRSSGVEMASLSIHSLQHPLPDDSGLWKTKPTSLVLMLAPKRITRETQDILNEISVSLLDARTIEVLRECDEQNIQAHYTRYLDRFFRSFPNQGA